MLYMCTKSLAIEFFNKVNIYRCPYHLATTQQAIYTKAILHAISEFYDAIINLKLKVASYVSIRMLICNRNESKLNGK